jgi:hypothetical protein
MYGQSRARFEFLDLPLEGTSAATPPGKPQGPPLGRGLL